MFEEKKLMPHKVKPIINETILNLNHAIQCDIDQKSWQVNLLHLKLVMGQLLLLNVLMLLMLQVNEISSCYSSITLGDEVCLSHFLG